MDGGLGMAEGLRASPGGPGGSPTALPGHRMEELGLHPADRQVCFGQLLGMCDQISFPLGELGLPGGRAGGVGVETQHPCLCMQARRASLCTSTCPMAL